MLVEGKLYSITADTSEFINWDTYNAPDPGEPLLFLEWSIKPEKNPTHLNRAAEADFLFRDSIFGSRFYFRVRLKFLHDEKIIEAVVKRSFSFPKYEDCVSPDPSSTHWFISKRVEQEIWDKCTEGGMFAKVFDRIDETD